MDKFANTGLDNNLINEIKSYAQFYGVDKIVIFGSRARGDYKKKSDIDLAFYGGDSSEFILCIDEDVHTLLKFDVVDLNRPVDEDLRKSIEKEGIVIYEKI